MRKKLIIAGAAGALTLAGLGVALPALADDDPAQTGTTSEERIRDALSDLVDNGSISQEQADEVAATLSDAGFGGHHGGWGGHGFGGDLLATAADAIGISEDDLRSELQADDASLASVAQAHQVDPQVVIDALVQAATERIEQAVTDGDLTREEADERLADLEARITERVNSTDGPGGHRGGWGGHGGDHD
ncbi:MULTISPECIES: hypothetical protein [unclassified Blastococcus]